MPSWLVYSSAPSGSLPLNGSWSFLPALSRNRPTLRSSSLRDSSKKTRSIHANSPCYKAKERRVNQSICREILEYGARMSKWHGTVYTGRDLSPQPANHTPNSNRSNSKSHLKVTSLTSCKSKPVRLQEHLALNLLGNEVIRLLWLSCSTVIVFH